LRALFIMPMVYDYVGDSRQTVRMESQFVLSRR